MLKMFSTERALESKCLKTIPLGDLMLWVGVKQMKNFLREEEQKRWQNRALLSPQNPSPAPLLRLSETDSSLGLKS